MNLLNKINRAISNPAETIYRLVDKINNNLLIQRYSKKCTDIGINKLYLILSFDCDTEEDIIAAKEMHPKLMDIGVKPIYAVPGELLIKGEETYRKILDNGGVFINHGYRQHTYFDNELKRHASSFFYDKLSDETIKEDIIKGDELINSMFGIKPKGFRTPHFGTYQKKKNLCYLHKILGDLNYSYSSSTVPYYSYRFGPVFNEYGIMEIPVSGMGTKPFTILDTWGFFHAYNRVYGPEDYQKEGISALNKLLGTEKGILNFYADPSHVKDSDIFLDTVKVWMNHCEPTTFEEIVNQFNDR